MPETKCIITSASNKFFPSLLNMLGSLHKNYPDHPPVFIYDLGLAWSFKSELQNIKWIKILPVPHFVKHWRACYTWKTYILNTPLAENNLYIDAGCEILKPLDALFDKINLNGYLSVSQGDVVTVNMVTPKSLLDKYQLGPEFGPREIVTAGIFGFKKDSSITQTTEELYKAGIDGECLGYSKQEMWKNKGPNKVDIVRDCPVFRHDTTLLTILLYKNFSQPIIENIKYFSADLLGKESGQFIWNNRLNYSKLNYVSLTNLDENINIFTLINRLFVQIFLVLKFINRKIKKLP